MGASQSILQIRRLHSHSWKLHQRPTAKKIVSPLQPPDDMILDIQGAGECPVVALSDGTRHRPATPELRPGADIENQMSALSDFRRLYLRVRTLRMAVPLVRR